MRMELFQIQFNFLERSWNRNRIQSLETAISSCGIVQVGFEVTEIAIFP